MENNELNNVNSVAENLENSIEGKQATDEQVVEATPDVANEQPNGEQIVTPVNVAQKVGEQKYRIARSSLLIVVILSVVNLFSLIFSGSYFLFSSYITLIIGAVGAESYIADPSNTIFLVVIIVLGIISVLPYLVCWIFSKKKVGWLIGALVLFSFDTLLLLIDAISVMNLTFILDLVIHAYFIYEMVVAVKFGLKKKKEEQENQF
ncbi:MAG: hypothetical protein II984_08580 [Clostridia bacterium]|nr:hypothetical protein [Clostridia bacterium]